MSKELTMEKTSLPAGWELKKLIELGEVQTGTTPSTSNKGFYGSFIPFVKPPHFNPNGTISFSSSGLSEIGLLKGRFVRENSILMVCIGASIGKTGITPIPVSCNQQINAFSPNESCFPKFYYYLLSSDYFFKKVMKRSSQATLPMINKKNWQNIEIPFPPLTQQKQIVAILDKAFAAIDTAKANAKQNLQNAKELFESYLQNVFENKGNDWEEKRIKDLTELVTKGSSPKWQGVNYIDEGGIFFLTSKNVGEGELLLNNKKYLEEKFNDIQKTSILKKGDVLTNIVGASIGRTAIFNLDEITNINQAVCLMRCNSEKVYNYYLLYLLNSPFFKNILHDNEVDNARANLSLTFFKNLAIPLPKLLEQKEIVKNIKSFSTETKKLEAIYTQKIADLEELKKSVLQKAFSGQLT